MSTGAQPTSGIATYRILRELGARSQRSYAAIREPHELLVVHRFVKEGAQAPSPSSASAVAVAVSTEQLGLLLRDAQCLAKNWHPNIARIKHVDLAGGELTIASELVDGSTLADLIALATAKGGSFPLDVLVRVLLDVLAGIHGIHGLRDGRNVPIGAIHGEVCPTNIVVGRDGVARIVNALRPRPLRIAMGSEAVGYAAPETVDGGVVDGRADVHAVGVILWEVLSGRRLHDEQDPVRVLSRQREIDIPPPMLPPGSAFAALADIAMRALSFDPALRFRTAAGMAAELRKLPAARLATGSVVASRVLALDGERIRGRRAALDPTSSGGRRHVSAAAISAVQADLAAPTDRTPAPSPAGLKPIAGAPPRPAAPSAAEARSEARAEAPPASEPPMSLELEEIPASAPETVRQDQRSAPQPPPVPPRAGPSAPKPAPRPPVVATREKKPAAPVSVAVAQRPALAPAPAVAPAPALALAIEERITVPGAPAMLGATVEERVTVAGAAPAAPVIVAPLIKDAPAFDDRLTVPGAPAVIPRVAVRAAPLPVDVVAPVAMAAPSVDFAGVSVDEASGRAAVPPADMSALDSLARSTSTSVADEPSTRDRAAGAGVTAAGTLDSVDDVDVVAPPSSVRRYRWLAVAAVLLLLGGTSLVFGSRSRPDQAAAQGVPAPSEIATLTTAPLTTAAPAIRTPSAGTNESPADAPASAPTSADEPDEPETPASAPVDSTPSPRSAPPAAPGAPRTAPRPTNRRYEPLGI